MSTDPMKTLGAKIKAERVRQRYGVRAAADAAGIARDTWKKIELGEGVQDTKRGAALELLGLDWNGEPVGTPEQDAKYVASPGERVEARDTDDEVLRAIGAMADNLDAMQREQRALSERMAKLEQQGPQPMGGTSGPV